MKQAAALALSLVAWAAHADEAGEPFTSDEPVLEAPRPDAGAEVLQEGHASWYGLPFHGRRTASGERFDMTALTAAHPWLPFGTLVKVKSLVNGREVTVRINDRGPHVGGRIIDLSHAAARSLGLLGIGTKRVALSVAEPAGRERR